MDIINYSKIKKLEEQINNFAALLGLGGVVGSGNNENGSYIKFADGTMICTKNQINIICETANQDVMGEWIFPAIFSGYPVTFANINAPNQHWHFNINKLACNRTSNSRTEVRLNASVAQTYFVGLFAIGRWKA